MDGLFGIGKNWKEHKSALIEETVKLNMLN